MMEGKKRLNEKVVKTLEEQPLWYVSTCSDIPENAIIGFHEVLDDGRLLLCDVFMKNTRRNILANGRVCIAVCKPDTMVGYQIDGTAEYQTEGEYLDAWKSKVDAFFGGKIVPKGVVLITPERVRIASPSPKNGEEL